MKANELMIGDWCRMRRCDIPDATFYTSKVLCLQKDGFLEYEPIPLTADILKANGFEDETSDFWKLRVDDKPHHYAFKLNKGGVFGSDGYNMNCNIYTITIKFVHELQQALRLCGLNELADNLKVE